jgi:hypothetical protein
MGLREEMSPVHLLPIPSPLLLSAPVLDERLLQDVFAEEGREGGYEEGTEEEKEGFDYGQGGKQKEGEEDKAGLDEDSTAPLPIPQMLDSYGYPSTSIEQQHQQYQQYQHYLQQGCSPQQQQPLPQPYHYHEQDQQRRFQQPPHLHHMQAQQGIAGLHLDRHNQEQLHMSSVTSVFHSPPTHSPQQPQQQYQHAYPSAAALFPVTGKVEEGKEAESGRVACVPRLSSFLPVPTPAFEDGIVQDVFAEGGREGVGEGRLKDTLGRGAEAEGVDKDVIGLFNDGDIESW